MWCIYTACILTHSTRNLHAVRKMSSTRKQRGGVGRGGGSRPQAVPVSKRLKIGPAASVSVAVAKKNCSANGPLVLEAGVSGHHD